jgi:hypothetical protein
VEDRLVIGRFIPRAHKYFTLSEANRTSLVRRIVSDITALYPRWRDLVYRYELVAVRRSPTGASRRAAGAEPANRSHRRRHQPVPIRARGSGLRVQGFEQGLVDFYGQIDGRDVFWCWKNGKRR